MGALHMTLPGSVEPAWSVASASSIDTISYASYLVDLRGSHNER